MQILRWVVVLPDPANCYVPASCSAGLAHSVVHMSLSRQDCRALRCCRHCRSRSCRHQWAAHSPSTPLPLLWHEAPVAGHAVAAHCCRPHCEYDRYGTAGMALGRSTVRTTTPWTTTRHALPPYCCTLVTWRRAARRRFRGYVSVGLMVSFGLVAAGGGRAGRALPSRWGRRP